MGLRGPEWMYWESVKLPHAVLTDNLSGSMNSFLPNSLHMKTITLFPDDRCTHAKDV